MTRENKLALVVGFALILFVGILISDHFSMAQNQASADLNGGIRDPLARVQDDQPGLIDYQILANPTEIPSQTVADPAPADPKPRTRRGEELAYYMGQPEAIGLDQATFDDQTFSYHEIKPGESLSSIARHYFNDSSKAAELAAYNGITDPNNVSSGRRIKIPQASIPVASDPIPTRAVPAPDPVRIDTPPALQAPTYASYTIKKGDILSKLSQQLLGTTRRMRELLELNKDVIKNPDRLIPGTVLRVPKD